MDSTDTPNASVTVHRLDPFYRPSQYRVTPLLLSITLRGHAYILYRPKSSSLKSLEPASKLLGRRLRHARGQLGDTYYLFAHVNRTVGTEGQGQRV
jgi:hypothetical protein